MRQPVSASLSLLVCAAGNLSAQGVTGNLEGRVATTNSFPIADVQVAVSGPSQQGIRYAFTDWRGQFRIVAVPGSYTVRISRLGYRPLVIEEVRIFLGRTTTLGLLTLEIEAIAVKPVIVSARAVEIDPFSTTTGANLKTAVLEEIPIERDYQSAVVLLPHTNTSYYGDGISSGGSTGLENLFYVNGVKVTTPYKATGSTRFPYNFVKEIEVKQGSYEARYGGALGAVVNVITHSGTNRWETHAFGYFTNSALAGDPRPGFADPPARDFATYDVGARVSGPILRDRLWFSAAYNPQVQTRDLQALNLGFFEDRRTEHRFAAKLNWRVAEKTDVELSAFGDPTTHHHVGPSQTFFTSVELDNPDPWLWRTEEGGLNLSLLARQHLGTKALIEASLARSQSEENTLGDTEIARRQPFFHDARTGRSEGGVLWTENVANARTAAELNSTLFLGRHTVTAGGRYEVNGVDYTVRMPEPGAIVRFDDAAFFVNFVANELSGQRNRIPAVYAQDSWQLTDRVTLNAGLRWEAQHLYGAGDSIAQSFTNQWQPRLGVTYQPGERGTQKLFGFFGRFYQQRPLFSTVQLFSGYEDAILFYSMDPREPNASPDFEDIAVSLVQKREDIAGEYVDELTVGYERVIGRGLRLGVRGVHRVLRDAWGAGLDSLGRWVTGNPGRGNLSFLPRPRREYSALELTAEHRGDPLYLLFSYVLSRSYGNYTGLFSTDNRADEPDANRTFRCEEHGANSTGLLPNDRPHVLKLLSSYRFGFGLSTGGFFTFQSGTPLSEFRASSPNCFGVFAPVHLVRRGSTGRMPSTWDLNLRFAYRLGFSGGLAGRLVLDVLHIGSPRRALVTDQLRFLDEEQEVGNPTFGASLVHQPPMTVRLGFEIGF